jgi:glycolate oxidase iron-sulfur subunit
VHCGLCLSSCPTYVTTGREASSPRGRIYLIKMVTEGNLDVEDDVFTHQMSECLNCRACEAVCPSGVKYGQLVEAARDQIQQVEGATQAPQVKAVRGAVFGLLFRDMRLFRAFSWGIRLYQRSGLQALVRRSGILKLMRLEAQERMLPQMDDKFFTPRGNVLPATNGVAEHTVGVFAGCIQSTAFAGVQRATARVLAANGNDVCAFAGQGCCGALHAHAGDLDGARDLARVNIDAFEKSGAEALIVNAAGCGAQLKDYAHLMEHDPEYADRAVAFAAKVNDATEWLAKHPINTADMGAVDVTVTYQEPCHLCHAQRISRQPRTLLNAIPGVKLIEMNESSLCCGSAGIYNITQPEMATKLGERKVANALATDAEMVISANPGCMIQMGGILREHGSDMEVAHIMSLIDRAYQAGELA